MSNQKNILDIPPYNMSKLELLKSVFKMDTGCELEGETMQEMFDSLSSTIEEKRAELKKLDDTYTRKIEDYFRFKDIFADPIFYGLYIDSSNCNRA